MGDQRVESSASYDEPSADGGGVLVLQVLWEGRRARTELVRLGDGRAAVRKTFRPGCERFCDREVSILRRFAGMRPEVPELLGAGPNWFITPFYANDYDTYKKEPHGRFLPRRLLPLHIARAAFDFYRFLHRHGIATIDWHPRNVLYNPRDGVKVIDYEFAYEYPGEPPPFEQSYDVRGVPPEFDGDLPPSWRWHVVPYDYRWYGHVGLTLDSLLHDPVWLQHLKRFVYQCRTFCAIHRARLTRPVPDQVAGWWATPWGWWFAAASSASIV